MSRLIIHEGSRETRKCSCCPTMTVRVEGDIEDDGNLGAWYMVSWTPQHATALDGVLSLPPYEGEPEDAPFTTVCLLARPEPAGLATGFVEPESVFTGTPPTGCLTREQALAHPDRALFFQYWDAICHHDTRVRGVITAARPRPRRKRR